MVSTTNYIEVLNDILFKWEEEGAWYAPFSYSWPYNDNSTYNYANVRMASSKYFEWSVKVRWQTGIWSGWTIFRLTPYTNSYDIANSIVFYIAKDQIPWLDQTRIWNTSNCAHTNIEWLTWLSWGCGSTTIFWYSTSKTLTQYTYIPNWETLACPSGYTETWLTWDKACKK